MSGLVRAAQRLNGFRRVHRNSGRQLCAPRKELRRTPLRFLLGVSSTATNFLGRPPGSPPAAWFSVPQYFGMANLSLEAPANPNLLLSSGTTTGNPLASGHLFFSDVNFASTADASAGRELMFAIAGPDIQVYNSFFLSGSNQAFDINYGDGAIVSGNQIVLNNFTGLGISDSQNVIFEDNLTYSQNPLGQGTNGTSGGSGLSVSRGNNQYGRPHFRGTSISATTPSGIWARMVSR